MLKKNNFQNIFKPFAILFLVSLLFSRFTISVISSVHAQEGTPDIPTSIPPTPTGEVTGQIVGGNPADPGEWPWQVALIDGSGTNLWYNQFCGGALASSEWVVTAAHCVSGIAPSQVDVVAGVYDLWNPAPGYQRRDVSKIIIHPSYNPSTSDSDIALLRLTSPVVIGGSGETKTSMIPMASSKTGNLSGVSAWVTGWGTLSSGGAFPDQLYEVQIPIIANSICNDINHYYGLITNNMICAGLPSGGKDACQGDSGGPMVVQIGGHWHLAGVISWGNGCAELQYPGVYTRISNFEWWVNSNTGTFADVSASHWAWQYIESIYNTGMTGGCGSSPLIYCPEDAVTRAQMAVFLEKGVNGSAYRPPKVTSTFSDTVGHWAEDWIEALKSDGITGGCGSGNYCPDYAVTRAQMAIFLLKAIHGSFYIPPDLSPTFGDTAGHWAEDWIEQLAKEGITGGCGGGNYCPDHSVTRAQMAVFLQKTFNLTLP